MAVESASILHRADMLHRSSLAFPDPVLGGWSRTILGEQGLYVALDTTFARMACWRGTAFVRGWPVFADQAFDNDGPIICSCNGAPRNLFLERAGQYD